MVISRLLPARVLLRIAWVVRHGWRLGIVHSPSSMLRPVARVVVGIVGYGPDCTNCPKALPNHELDSVGMLQTQCRTQGSLESFSGCLPESSQGVQSCFPEIRVVVEIEEVHGLLLLGELLRPQKLRPPSPVSVVEKSRINPLPDIPERTFPPTACWLGRDKLGSAISLLSCRSESSNKSL